MRYLITLLILVASEILYCTLLIGSDPIIVGHTDMTGALVSSMDIALLAIRMSLIFFPLVAAIYLFLNKKLISAPTSAKLVLPPTYIIPWLCIAATTAGFYEDMYGATWSGLEFSFFYLLSFKALSLAAIIIVPSYMSNRWLVDRLQKK